MTHFSQGDIVSFSYDPTKGHEPQDHRPSVVVSNDEYQRMTSLVVVCPITRTDSGYPLHFKLPEDCVVEGAICVEQLRSVDLIARKAEVIGSLDKATLAKVSNAAKLFF
ncbi:MAG: type II toxin-antitoxin system PemK/MazF family toxin [Coriobacteriales bacterium]|nr:type II toxin-antitoxin system PemK/MazF family toxin [Coriobacteriales bacterium]